MTDVLSEGEHRIISIAAFLADVANNPHNSPFVFDDPISSLDHNFEELVAKRLALLAQERQVIIFTHRLSFVGLLQDEIGKLGTKPKVIALRSQPWGHGEPGETLISQQKPKAALNSLHDIKLAKAEKIYLQEGMEEYYIHSRCLCSDFRDILERVIENILLADVVCRYRRSITTQGKIKILAIVDDSDCHFFDELMAKYSKYAHSQPTALPINPLTPSELRTDFRLLLDWIDAFAVRKKSKGLQ